MRKTMRNALKQALAGALVLLCSQPAAAADCAEQPGQFPAWLQRFEAKARTQGISNATLAKALDGISYDPNVIRLDRSQRSFKLSFAQFYANRVDGALLRKAQAMIRKHKSTLDRIEQRFGVPPEILVSIWGLETNFGADTSGKFSIIRSLATLAFDCRRSDFFTPQLVDALRIVDRGDLTLAEMRGGWAGEIGYVQFLPTPYIKYAVDFDGDGRRDLTRSVPDMLASTANFLKSNGWQAGAAWGPGTRNYAVLREWNKAEVYQRTIAVMAEKLKSGAL